MKRSRLSSNGSYHGKTRLSSRGGYHPKFKTQLKKELHKISEKTGHAVGILEAKFMREFDKMPLNKRFAVSEGVGIGGMYASMIIAGTIFGAPLVGAIAGIPFVSAVIGRDIYTRQQQRKALKELEKTMREFKED